MQRPTSASVRGRAVTGDIARGSSAMSSAPQAPPAPQAPHAPSAPAAPRGNPRPVSAGRLGGAPVAAASAASSASAGSGPLPRTPGFGSSGLAASSSASSSPLKSGGNSAGANPESVSAAASAPSTQPTQMDLCGRAATPTQTASPLSVSAVSAARPGVGGLNAGPLAASGAPHKNGGEAASSGVAGVAGFAESPEAGPGSTSPHRASACPHAQLSSFVTVAKDETVSQKLQSFQALAQQKTRALMRSIDKLQRENEELKRSSQDHRRTAQFKKLEGELGKQDALISGLLSKLSACSSQGSQFSKKQVVDEILSQGPARVKVATRQELLFEADELKRDLVRFRQDRAQWGEERKRLESELSTTRRTMERYEAKMRDVIEDMQDLQAAKEKVRSEKLEGEVRWQLALDAQKAEFDDTVRLLAAQFESQAVTIAALEEEVSEKRRGADLMEQVLLGPCYISDNLGLFLWIGMSPQFLDDLATLKLHSLSREVSAAQISPGAKVLRVAAADGAGRGAVRGAA